MTCQEQRYQKTNKQKLIHYFKELLIKILPEPKKRISTKIPKCEREIRILEKKYIAKKKQNRQKPPLENYTLKQYFITSFPIIHSRHSRFSRSRHSRESENP